MMAGPMQRHARRQRLAPVDGRVDSRPASEKNTGAIAALGAASAAVPGIAAAEAGFGTLANATTLRG